MNEVIITKEEEKAIASLERLAKKWPDSISLFSWSGTLVVMKHIEDGRLGYITTIEGIPNDGGDPSDGEVDSDVEVIYE
ncbi:MAG: hypothetical protein DRO67_06400 [Candidatus Asgardarchaeum californiense]|nr:MAG: hypothetical protein DRO67_06400 [Candidatus Asgardarchaeum californiense]